MASNTDRIGRLLRPFLAGTLVSIWSIVNALVFATLVWSGPLSGLLVTGLSATLAGFVIATIIIASTSPQLGIASTIIVPSAAIYAAVSGMLVSRLQGLGITDATLLAQAVLSACAVLSVVTGLMFFALGALRLGSVGQWLPYPVVYGYNAGIGWVFVTGGLVLSGGADFDLHSLFSLTNISHQVLVSLALAAILLVLQSQKPHWIFLPAALFSAALVFHIWRWQSGMDLSQVQRAAWVFGPFPQGQSILLPSWHGLALFDRTIWAELARFGAANILLTAIALILIVSALDIDLRRSIDTNRELRIAGIANLLGGATGGLPSGHGLAATLLLHQQGGGTRFAACVPAFWAIVLLIFGASLLAYVPRFIVAGLLISVGVERLVLRLWRDRRTLPGHESAIAILVALGIIAFGIINGLALGLLAAVIIFAWNYRRIPVIRMALSGLEVHSSVARAPGAIEQLAISGRSIALFRLQGYLFFLNVIALREAVEARQKAGVKLTHLILDFQDVVGMDGSALMAFRKIEQIAEAGEFELGFSHCSPSMQEMLQLWGFGNKSNIRLFDSADLALQHAEDALLAGQGATAQEVGQTLASALSRSSGRTIDDARLAPFIDEISLDAGDVLMRQGEPADALYYINSGRLTAERAQAYGPAIRLQTTVAGALIGEVAIYSGGTRTANVRAEEHCCLSRLTIEALQRMERDDPALSSLLQRYLIIQLAIKLADTTRRLDLGQR